MTCKLNLHARIFSLIILLISSTLMAMAQNPVPFINQPLVPDAVALGKPGSTFALAVNGTGFVPGSKVNWNGRPRTTAFASSSRLVALILSSDIAHPTTATVTVVSPGPGGGTSNAVFLPIKNPSPSVSFSHRTDYSFGAYLGYVETADFNRDGNLDLVVANPGYGSVSVLLGNGDGTFQDPEDYGVGGSAGIPIVGDFNRDGKLDLAVPASSSAMAVLLGRGDGSFLPPVTYPTSCPTHGITADFNRDGKLDLALVSSGSDAICILLGNGDGTFRASVEYGAGNEPTNVAAGDFNRDGKLDIAVSNLGSGTVSILPGKGDGTFQPPVDYSTGNTPYFLTVADLNGDGKLDLIAPSLGQGTVALLMGNGDGTFRPHVDILVADAGHVVVGDLNQDGKLDMAMLGWWWGDIAILLGNGDGTFQAPSSYPTGGGSRGLGVLAADFNGDGRLDIATANEGWSWEGSVSVLSGFTGPVSKYYLDGWSMIYVVQGTTVVASFPTVYGQGGLEGALAVSKTIRTRASDFEGQQGAKAGEYTLTGNPTGYSYDTPHTGNGVYYDGASDGFHNYFVDHGQGDPLMGGVYRTDYYWQSPEWLFYPYEICNNDPEGGCHGLTGIAYDPTNKSLWISGKQASVIGDYSLDGVLLSIFDTFHSLLGYNSAVAVDPADHTLWVTSGGTGELRQYSLDGETFGKLLQIGTPDGLVGIHCESGEFQILP